MTPSPLLPLIHTPTKSLSSGKQHCEAPHQIQSMSQQQAEFLFVCLIRYSDTADALARCSLQKPVDEKVLSLELDESSPLDIRESK